MYESILIPFGVIFAAEFLDKSQISVLLLSSRTNKYLHLLLGIFLAFLVVDGVAIFFGAFLTTLVPELWLRLISAGLFILFGVKSLLEKPSDSRQPRKTENIFFSAFMLIFISEWGDKTQLSSALFATQYQPLFVLIGVMTALSLISLLTVVVGKTLFAKFDRGIVTKIAGVVFILLGISVIFLS